MERFRSLGRVRARLEDVLEGTLPGSEAQGRMSPRPRRGWRPGVLPDDTRAAAALVLLYAREGLAHVLLTLRHQALSAHAGQISLPGGVVEPGEAFVEAALREAHEEVGLEPESVTVIGELTPLHIPASGFRLHAFVGIAERLGRLVPSDIEVARVLEVPLEDLASAGRLHVETWELRGGPAEVPFFRIDDLELWGATAMVLAELLTILGAPPDPWTDHAEQETASDTLGDGDDGTTLGTASRSEIDPEPPRTRES